MKKYLLLLIFLCSLIGPGCASGPRQEVCFEKGCIEVELARTPQELEKGLSKRASLGENKGMVFIFPVVDQYNFWMKDTLIPLDILWISENGYINYIAQNLPPCTSDPCPTYTSPKKSRFVLEINAGKADKLNLKEGSKIQFRFNI